MKQNKNIQKIIHELRHHAPFTFSATLIAVIFVIIIFQIKSSILTSRVSSLFELMHFGHLFVSATVSAAIFHIHTTRKNNFLKTLFVGITGAIIIGSISDVLLPYFGGILFGLKTTFHLPLIEEPMIVLLIAFAGSLFGIKTKLTKLPHFIHVFLSIFAGLFYLIAFSATFTLLNFIIAFAIIFVTVLVPCCLSDIIFPFLFLGEKIKHCGCGE